MDSVEAAGQAPQRQGGGGGGEEVQKLRLVGEEIVEVEYQPTVCKRPYRLVILRKNLSVEKGGRWLFDDWRYLPH